MSDMFYNASVFNQDISGWNVSNVSIKPPLDFSTGSALTAANTPIWFPIVLDTNNVTIKYVGSSSLVPSSSALFIEANPRGTGNEWFAVVKDGMKQAITDYAKGLSGSSTPFTPSGQSSPVPFNNIVTTLMTDMSYMFANATVFNQPLNSWDVSAVTNMSVMFGGAAAFNQPLNSWNVSNVTSMDFMFYNATVFNQDISGWNVSSVSPKPPSDFSTGSALTAANNPAW